MLDALHNLALRARQCRAFSFSVTLHDDGHTHVTLSCLTDDDVHEVAAMLRLDGAYQSQPPQMTGNKLHTWLGTTFHCGGMQIRVIGPQHAVTQEAA